MDALSCSRPGERAPSNPLVPPLASRRLCLFSLQPRVWQEVPHSPVFLAQRSGGIPRALLLHPTLPSLPILLSLPSFLPPLFPVPLSSSLLLLLSGG